MAVTAKFRINRNSDMGWGHEIEMTPDYAHGRNKQWAEATPAGMCRLTVKGDVADEFVENQPITLIFVQNPQGEVTDQEVAAIVNAGNAEYQQQWDLEKEGKVTEAIEKLEKRIRDLKQKYDID